MTPCVLVLMAAVTMCAAATPQPDDAGKARDLVIKEFPVLRNRGMPQLVPVNDARLTAMFPGLHFFVLGFRQFPVAQGAPKPLRTRNLFVVTKDGKVQLITDVDKLQAFFQASATPAQTEETARNAVAAWLRLSEELKQDGFFKFSIPPDALASSRSNGKRQASGKAVVTQGGKGEIRATLTFSEAGKLLSADETNAIKPGVRPICQATKLLDPDPIVRRMAEADILIMGRDARPYLDEERVKASAELKRAIDRVWERIVTEDW